MERSKLLKESGVFLVGLLAGMLWAGVGTQFLWSSSIEEAMSTLNRTINRQEAQDLKAVILSHDQKLEELLQKEESLTRLVLTIQDEIHLWMQTDPAHYQLFDVERRLQTLEN